MTLQKAWNWLMNPPTDAPRSTIVLRIMAGSVFFWEGVMKLVFANLGPGRFTKLGFPFPGPTADFVAWIEIIGGLLMLAGWLTRPVAIAFVFEMAVAMLSTKVSMYFGHSPLPLPPSPPQTGFWAVLHEIRSEYAQMFTSLFLVIAGPGPLSLDAKQSTASRPFAGRLVGVAAILLSVVGFTQAAPSESAGADATPAVQSAFDKGQAAVKNKEYKTASQYFQTALKDQPKNPDVLNMLAFSLRKQGQLGEAFEYYQQALEIKPHFPEAREYLAEAHLQAALKELATLKTYGPEGKEDAEEVEEAIKSAAKGL